MAHLSHSFSPNKQFSSGLIEIFKSQVSDRVQ